ncbi:MAG: phage holin family protein [Syntrophaceae bacterium]|nr:phage holin family protein [Syntrophaceae bacterium]
MASADQDPVPNRPAGLFDSAKRLAATLLAVAHARVELFSVELEEEWVRISSILTWSLVAMFCAGIGVVLATLFLVFALWDAHPLLALGIPAALFLVIAGLSWRLVRAKARAKPRPFAASLAELAKDRDQLTSRP